MDTKATHILLFSTAYSPYIGGAELALKEITKRIRDLDFDLITMGLDKKLPREEMIDNVDVFRVGGTKILYPWHAFIKAMGLHKKNKYDVAFALQASYGGGAAWLFKLLNPNIPFILNIQEGENLESQRFFIKFFRKIIIRKANVIIAISNYLAEYVRGINKKAKVYIIPNGVDLEKFQIPDKLQINPKSRNPNNKTIITVSRLVKKNSIADLIDAFNILNIKHKILNTELIIIGGGHLESELKLKVKNLNLEERVKFMGEVKNEELPQYLANADIFVRPSLSEGLGIAFLEAMAMGLPIVGTSVGGIPDFLIDRETGLFCKPNDPEDLSNKIDLLLKDDLLRQKLARNGRKLVEEKYSWDRIAKEYEKIFKIFNIQA